MITPIGNRVAVEVIREKEESVGGFKIADNAKGSKPIKVRLLHDSGQLKQGDILFIEAYGYTAIKDDLLVVPNERLICKES